MIGPAAFQYLGNIFGYTLVNPLGISPQRAAMRITEHARQAHSSIFLWVTVKLLLRLSRASIGQTTYGIDVKIYVCGGCTKVGRKNVGCN